jgi:hypothetical protein
MQRSGSAPGIRIREATLADVDRLLDLVVAAGTRW